jgi:hypothetical protein
MIRIDQSTGERHGPELLAVLSRHRRKKGKLAFGVLLANEGLQHCLGNSDGDGSSSEWKYLWLGWSAAAIAFTAAAAAAAAAGSCRISRTCC